MESVVDLKIVGNSDLTLEKTSNIDIFPRGDISVFEEVTDLFVCILNHSGTQIPGKLYHYAAYNKPVLVIEDGDYQAEMHDFIVSYNRYYTCKNDTEEIKVNIQKIICEDKKWEPCKSMAPEAVIDTILG